MTVAVMGLFLCAAAALEIEEEEKKRRRRSEKTIVSEQKNKSEGLVEEKSATGPQQDFATRTGTGVIARLKTYLRINPDTFIKIQKWKKKNPFLHVSD